MLRILAVVTILICGGCASFQEEHSRTLLMNRSTGEMKECTVEIWRNQQAYDKYRECVKEYEAQGYTVWNQY